MAKILFVPICSKCEKIIRQTVDCIKPTPWFLDEGHYKLEQKDTVQPEFCPNCGVRLESIVIPQHIPFNINLL